MNAIEVRIYNPDLELQGIIDEFSSLIWIRRYQGAGEFELHTPYSEESRQLLVAENVVQKYDGKTSTEAGVIEFIKINRDEIVVKGRFWEIYMDFHPRGFQNFTSPMGTVEWVLRWCMSIEFVEVPMLELGEEHGLTEAVTFNCLNLTLLNIASKMCRASGLGFRIFPDFTEKKMYFEVYKGVDRSSDSSSKVIFSETYDNLYNEEYTYDISNYRNAAIVRQIDDNGVMQVASYHEDPDQSGNNDRRLPVISCVATGEKTEEQIHDLLIQAAKDVLIDHKIVETFKFATDPEGTFKYREDYDLGDLVIINQNAWGIYQVRRITEVEEDYENGKVTIIPTCGDPLPETIDFKEGF